MAGFWWWGNVFMAMWAGVTIAAGVRYADGKAVNGPLAFLGRIFDSMFGLDTCRKIPARNQNIADLKQPAYFCSTGANYPHADEQGFIIEHDNPPNVAAITGVNGVGGINGSRFIHGNKGAIDPVTYINTIITGSPTGSVATGEYDKKRFKYGTPFAQYQTGSTWGYYYSTDDKGQEIPVLMPATGTSLSAPVYPSNNPFAYGGRANTGYFPPDSKGWVRYGYSTDPYTPDPTGMVLTKPVGKTWSTPDSTSTFDPLLGFVGGPKGHQAASSAQANIKFIETALSFIDNLKYKSFSPVGPDGSAQATNPAQWATRG